MNADLSRRSALAGVAAATALGTALRIAGLASDFWLDEVWSWWLARDLQSAAGVFTAIHHSNNHHLLTLWMFALGDGAPVWLYRLPSVLAGAASIPLAAALAWRRGRLEAVLAATGVAACFALVHFASEARGYALAVAFALGAQLVQQRFLARPSRAAALGFGALVCLGLLSHLGFAFYWSGAFVQSLWAGRRPGEPLVRQLEPHLLPIVALAVLYWLDLQSFRVGGGNPTELPALFARIFGFGFGLPVAPAIAIPAACVVGAALAAAARVRASRGDDSWIGDAVTIALAPLVVFALVQPDVIAVRYFLIGIAFALLLLADLAAAGLRAGGAGRVLAATACLVFLAGSALHDARFLADGRGGFRAALFTMAREDPSPAIQVASDHDFRTGSVLRFYARELPPERTLAYVQRGARPAGGVEWMILHQPQRPAEPAKRLRDAAGNGYALVAEFDHAAISGFYWALYRNERSSTTVPK